MDEPALMAAPRDASWYARPDVRSVKVCHVATEQWTALCRPARVLLDKDSAMPASQVPDGVRCQRDGCRARWPGRGDDE